MKLSSRDTVNIYGGDGFGIFAGISAAIAFLISIRGAANEINYGRRVKYLWWIS